ncbi:hypothetical protein Ppa06_17760 [Planomonospora parontospora subsp. parontospora]|uniref:Uncharacterized protein n=2 Tax=Planomonospora parontospora TaxID=58119 RepID=A0AA37BEC7_9ACTN|nr:hypothetical protein [Planomonospora parontospora]GGK59085.1 hypothetical protein GCM10010126_18320 [Planomonospora parontospora]GII07978.1 hypothetical protein Ppa06_17760 [Planomonospora parontospora subsp. parontospora]
MARRNVYIDDELDAQLKRHRKLNASEIFQRAVRDAILASEMDDYLGEVETELSERGVTDEEWAEAEARAAEFMDRIDRSGGAERLAG